MPEPASFDYAIVRVVPRVERGEFLNAGIILFSRTRRYLRAAIEVDLGRLRALAPWIDVEEVTQHLEVIPRIAAGEPEAGPMSQLPQAGRFHWLVSPRSTVVQVSPVHAGLADDPDGALEDLMNRLVRSKEQG
jgi:hypothetical protein